MSAEFIQNNSWQSRRMEKCGLVGAADQNDTAGEIVQEYLPAVEHRGPDGFGATVLVNGVLETERHEGLASIVLKKKKLKLKKGKRAIGHTRYRTKSGLSPRNLQPATISSPDSKYQLSGGHNGNLWDDESMDAIFGPDVEGLSDSVRLMNYLSERRNNYESWDDTLVSELARIQNLGTFNLMMATDDGSLYGVMDPTENRPMSIGKKGEAWVLASENHEFEEKGIDFVRELVGGEIVKINSDGEISSQFFGTPRRKKRCLFERKYFARRNSYIGGQKVDDYRKKTGELVAGRAREKGIQFDVVASINGSGAALGEGISEHLDIPRVAVDKVRPQERTFLKPDEKSRDEAANKAYIITKDGIQKIEGQSVGAADDTDVRGRTAMVTTKILWQHGASDVHRLFGSAPVVDICDMGVDMSRKHELANGERKWIPLPLIEKARAAEINATTVTYMPLEDENKALGDDECLEDMCFHCFGGPHPFRDNKDVFPQLDREVVKPNIDVWAIGNTDPAEIGILSERDDQNVRVAAVDDSFEVPSIDEITADMIVMVGGVLNLSDDYLSQLQEKQIPIMSIYPALVGKEGRAKVNSTRGEVTVVKDSNGMLMNNELSPASGVTAYQLMPGAKDGIGAIILREEVARKEEPQENWQTKMLESQQRVLQATTARVSHMMKRGVNVSQGFPW